MDRILRGVVLGLVLALTVSAGAAAKTFEVTRHGDPSPARCSSHSCSLREAIRAANAHPGFDRVLLSSSTRPYDLSRSSAGRDTSRTGDLDVAGDLTILHSGRARSSIDAHRIDRVLDIRKGAQTKLKKLTIVHGDSSGAGAAADRSARVTPTTTSAGGGVRSAARLLIEDCRISRNRADWGGGVALTGRARLSAVRTRMTNNRALGGGSGGAIAVFSGQVAISRSMLAGNDAGNSGGGLFLNSGHSSSISRTALSGNRASQGDGGAVELATPSSSDLRIASSTFSGNRAGGSGGAVHLVGSSLRATNSTFAGNEADLDGGAIARSAGSVYLNSTTVAFNNANADSNGSGVGGGLFTGSSTTSASSQAKGPPATSFNFANSLIALNRADGKLSDCDGQGPFGSGGATLLSVTRHCTVFVGPGDIVRRHPGIGRLGDHGGPTQTIPLLKSSPAVDRKRYQFVPYPELDQRGRRRGKKPDIGAFER